MVSSLLGAFRMLPVVATATRPGEGEEGGMVAQADGTSEQTGGAGRQAGSSGQPSYTPTIVIVVVATTVAGMGMKRIKTFVLPCCSLYSPPPTNGRRTGGWGNCEEMRSKV